MHCHPLSSTITHRHPLSSTITHRHPLSLTLFLPSLCLFPPQFHVTTCWSSLSISCHSDMMFTAWAKGEASQVAITALETFPRAMAHFVAIQESQSGTPWAGETWAWASLHTPVRRCTVYDALTHCGMVDRCVCVRMYAPSSLGL